MIIYLFIYPADFDSRKIEVIVEFCLPFHQYSSGAYTLLKQYSTMPVAITQSYLLRRRWRRRRRHYITLRLLDRVSR